MPIVRMAHSRRTVLSVLLLGLFGLANGCSDKNPVDSSGGPPPAGALTGDKMKEAMEKEYGPGGRPKNVRPGRTN